MQLLPSQGGNRPEREHRGIPCEPERHQRPHSHERAEAGARDRFADVPEVEERPLHPQLVFQRFGQNEVRRHDVCERQSDGDEAGRRMAEEVVGESADCRPGAEPDAERRADDAHAARTLCRGGDVRHVSLRRRDVAAGKAGDNA